MDFPSDNFACPSHFQSTRSANSRASDFRISPCVSYRRKTWSGSRCDRYRQSGVSTLLSRTPFCLLSLFLHQVESVSIISIFIKVLLLLLLLLLLLFLVKSSLTRWPRVKCHVIYNKLELVFLSPANFANASLTSALLPRRCSIALSAAIESAVFLIRCIDSS